MRNNMNKHNQLKELQNIITSMTNIMRSAGLNTLQYIEQITDLLYLKILDDNERNAEATARRIGKEYLTRLGDNRYRFYVWVKEETDYVTFLDELYNHLREIPNYHGHDNSGIRKIFKRSNLLLRSNAALSRVIEMVADIDLDDYDFDVKGAVYEFLLSKMQTEAGQLGQFFTPRHIVEAMIQMANPQVGERIYDPASGTGAFLTRAFKHVESQMIDQNIIDAEAWEFLRKEQFIGRDISETTIKICTMNMMLHGDGHTKIMHGDSLGYGANQPDQLNKMDVVLANPPFGSSTIPTEDLYDNFPIKTKNPENLFLQHIFLSLKDGGRACVVVPEGILFRTGADKRLRELLLEKTQVEAVISLPAGVFQPYTGVKTNIIVFKKGQPTEKVWFYNLEHDGFDLSANRRPISQNDIPDLLEKFKTKEESEKSWFATIEEIKKNDYSLVATRYKKTTYDTKYDLVKITDVCEIITTSVSPYDGEKYYLKTGNLVGSNIIGLESYTYENKPSRANLTVEIDDVLFSKMQYTKKSLLINNATKDIIFSTGFACLRPNKKLILPKYLYFMVNSDFFLQQKDKLAKGATQKAINNQDLENIFIPLPPLHIQEQYVKRLESQEEIIKQAEKMIKLLKETGFDESIFTQLDCEWKPIKEVAILNARSIKDLNKESFSYIDISSIENYTGNIIKENIKHYHINDAPSRAKRLVKENDVIISTVRPYLKGISFINKDFDNYICSTGFCVLTPDKSILLPKYLYYFVTSSIFINSLCKKMKGSNYPAVSQTDVGEELIPIPSIEKQQEIVNELNVLTNSINNFKELQYISKNTIRLILSEMFQ